MKYLFFGLLLGGCGLDSMNTSDTGQATFGDLSISPAAMDFGYVEPGESAVDSFVIQNQGGDPVALRGLGVVGSSAFSVKATTEIPPVLQKGDEVVLTIEFAPDAYEDFEAALAIQTDMPGMDYIERPIQGTGLRPSGDTGSGPGYALLTTDRTSVDFGEADIDGTVTETVLLQNVSTENVMVKKITMTDSIFGWDKQLSLPYLLKAGDAKEINLSFTPNAEQAYQAQAIIESDDPVQPEMVLELTGKGVDLCGICSGIIQVNTGEDPYELSGFMSLLGQEDKRTVSLTNIGDQTLTISDVKVMNDMIFTDGTFRITGFNGPMKLEPYEVGSFNVVYRATATGVELAIPEMDANVIHIYSDDLYEPDYVIGLTAVGIN